jgi:hypothetical protein
MLSPDTFTDEQREKFKDPEYYREFRHAVEHDINVSFIAQ